jgi:hypothetical protein
VADWVIVDGYEEIRSLERETGLEPATLCLGSRCSTTELLPPLWRMPPVPQSYQLPTSRGYVKVFW